MNKLKGYYNQKRRKDILFYICITIIPIIQFFIFYVGVNFNSIIMVFQEYKLDSETMKGTYTFLNGNIFGNFSQMFRELRYEPALGFAIKNSVIAFLVSVGVGTTLSLFFSLYIYKQMAFSKTFRLLLFAPSILSAVVTVLMYSNFVENALPSIFPSMEGQGLLSNPNTTMFAVLFFSIWIGFGVQILMYSGAMNTIEDSVIEAAKLDGVGPFKEFIYIIFPLIYPTFITFMVTNIAGLFVNQINLHAFYGLNAQDKYITIGYYLYKTAAAGTGSGSYTEYPVLACYGILFTVIAVPITLLGKRLLEKIGPKMV